MRNRHEIICGPLRSSTQGPEPLHLRLGPRSKRNIRLTIADIREELTTEIPDRFHDLIEIATYVYTADQAIARAHGGQVSPTAGQPELGDGWRRHFRFTIPVRCPDFWLQPSIQEQLRTTLGFLSDDHYDFRFRQLRATGYPRGIFDFGGTPFEGDVQEVMLFSGGLDSLAGAVDEIVRQGKRILLVNHRSHNKLRSRYRRLLSDLKQLAGRQAPVHLPVQINKDRVLGKEFTQRSRSFLYAAIGASIAAMLKLDRIRFYENGIVSLNLPLSPQVLGGRSTRTTHPLVLKGFSKLFTQVAGRPLSVENPFFWKTKTEVVQSLIDAGASKLIENSRSCAQTRARSHDKPHCGVCSQCVDRRFAILAADALRFDSADQYECDLLNGPRTSSVDRSTLSAYCETASTIQSYQTNPSAFFARYGELMRAIPHLGGPTHETARRLFDLYQRHASAVTGVIENALRDAAPLIRQHALPPDSLIAMYSGVSHVEMTEIEDPLNATEVEVTPGPSHLATSPSSQTPSRDLTSTPYFISPRENCWIIRFAGQSERYYRHETGLPYLQKLLCHPGIHFSVEQLESLPPPEIRNDELLDLKSLGSFQKCESQTFEPITDRQTILACESRLNVIRAELEGLDDSPSLDRMERREELVEEQQKIRATLKAARGVNGKSRSFLNSRRRTQDRVCRAIRRALQTITHYDSALASHLQVPTLTLGTQCVYDPRPEIRWDSNGLVLHHS